MIRNFVRGTIAIVKEAWNFDLRPASELVLFNFADNSARADEWEASSDSKYGGRSTSSFKVVHGKGIFEGKLSLDFDPDKTAFIKKSGFAGVGTKKGREEVDLLPFDTIEFRMKGDGRPYMTSLRTYNFIDKDMSREFEENTWQALINTKENEWKVYKVPFNDYTKSFKGKVLAGSLKLNPRRVVGIGFHCLARTQFGRLQPPGPGPFKLEIEWIKGVRTGVGYDFTSD